MRVLRRFVFAIVALVMALSAASSAAEEPLQIGLLYRYSGTGPPVGKAFDAAIAAYQAVHGDSVAGRKVAFVKRDDSGIAPETARRLAQELIVSEHVNALFGLLFTPNAVAVGAVAAQAKMPVFVTNAAGNEVIPSSPYMVRFGLTEDQSAAPLAQWAAKNGIKTVYSIFLDYGAGQDAEAAFKRAYLAAGGKLLGELAVPVSTQTYAPYIERMREAKPDAVFAFVGPSNGGQPFVKAWGAAGMPSSGVKLLATNDLTTDWNLPQLGDAAIGTISASNYYATLDNPQNKLFVKAFETAFGSAYPPDFQAVAAYDALDALYRVVGEQKGALDPDKTIALLRGMKIQSPRGPIEIDAQTREVIQDIYILRVAKQPDGTYVNVRIGLEPRVKTTPLSP